MCHDAGVTPPGPPSLPGPDPAFVEAWNALDPGDRRKLRRLVRIGRRPEEPHLAALVGPYARAQLARPWLRWFWVWFVPGLAIVLGAAAGVHPVLVGVVIALAAQAVYAWVQVRKFARTG